ncbi:phosphate acyltransferase [Staphylococcus sp. 17KM0847]|uniref:phosphate acyltransferase n=1 Tax=Staphylococcus sp. 17KM0847 TaxID=2583989 RepID=UPI0015DC0579|nr:phosphate acyltransferase [Staphylococcus sp. 17KM0847]QLK86099.1 phosphate butyryltransferase [Staphylococcus sp. 17KM0847]
MTLDQLLSGSHSVQATIAIVNAHDEKTLHAVTKILKKTSAAFIFYNHQDVSELIRSFDLSQDVLSRITIHTFDNQEQALKHCLTALDQKEADILMKGHISTAHLLSAVLHHQSSQNIQKPFLNHVAVFELPSYHKPLLLSDVALNIHPDIETMKAMIANIVDFTTRLNYKQLNIALLSSTESVQPKLASSVQAAELASYYLAHPINEMIRVEGPMALDNIIDKKSAIQKGVQSNIAGNTDVIIVPQLDVGNALYKSFTYFGQARVASIVLGASYPIILTSRADTIDNKLNSVLFAMQILVN